ncbi:MAG: sugar transferase [Lachnospiraceae bacterium]|nr:sugar transferase [Lachnospiraceae bacterium]
MKGKANKIGFYERYLKRPQDFLCALLALIVLSPLLLIVAAFVRLRLGSPVLFTQQRPGLGEKVFSLYKFRTMTEQRDEKGELLPDELRLPQFGKLLRALSLDELPELINILRGDMSVVGPRPLLVKYLPLYDNRQHRRHEVRPGLTGLAQIHGRNAISWEEKFELDVEYVENISFLGDWRIIGMTIWKVFRREGISSPGNVTMEEFRGSKGE